ncbi:VOC family protein [Actinophytocola algeriensis]|uniref:Putative enzyme related to lactoylglutathione lyase n=1 Tax=Actinophytocola algeriensis TaxID=1768010 RepID=A0A7W7VI62_9PSEU|nr:VOC family protein [Actinophytocola algeriensis]MBB4911113.1 putative enzyme related to lactoylglutathione lyase [Actinophytocola algeriensis]MBE1479052.1 putative enzyme related to lactoylglutathione lyase [Actinophytocola algeriensis]
MYYVIRAPDLARAKDFYTAVFGWSYTEDHHIQGSSPAGGLAEGEPGTDLYLEVPDAAAAVALLRELGREAPDPVLSKSGWSCQAEGGLLALWQPADGYAQDNPKCAEGDLFYFVVPVADDAALERYRAVLGWELSTGSHPNGWNIENSEPPGGVFVDHAGRPDLYFRVADVDEAARRIRDAGGTAGDTQPNSAGWHASCSDDQGVSFNIGALRQS